jgi:hypothetical protein
MPGTNKIINLSVANAYRHYITNPDGSPFTDSSELITFKPAGEPGDFAQVLSTQSFWMWDTSVQAWVDTDTGEGGGPVTWNDVQSKPTTFPPQSHSHPFSEVPGLQSALDGKAPTSHLHSISSITGLQQSLDNKLVAPSGGAPGNILTKTESGHEWTENQGGGGTGEDGLSAYEIAVLNGFNGTEVEWLLSLKGAPGEPGLPGAGVRWMGEFNPFIEYVEDDAVGYEGSAYIAKNTTEGNLPIDTDYWVLWVAKGPAGEDGNHGQDGTSGTQIHYTSDEIISPSLGVEGDYVISGYHDEGKLYRKIGGTWSYMNIRLQGQPGAAGQDGSDGQDGSNGLSAYEIWLANGNSGTERDFLDSLMGQDGQDGEPGPPGPAPDGGSVGDIIFKDSDGPVWKPFPKLRGQVFIPHEDGAIFDTVIRAAIANAVAGEVLDFTDWKGDHEISNTAVVIDKAITLLFGTINVWMESESRTKHMFEITSSSVAIIGYGRSPNRDTLTGPTRFTMTGGLGGGYHIRTFGASSLTFSGFDLIGVRSAWNQRESTFTGVGGMFIEKPDPDVTSSGNTVNNLIIENVLIKDTVAHAIYVDTPIISRITNVRISGAGRHGIYIKGGTSLVMDGVYVSSAHLAGICLHSVSYAAISASASEYCGIGYWFRSCFAVSLFGSGAEQLMNKQSGNVLFGTGYNDSGILNGNGNVIPDCSSTYRDAFRGVGYMISGGRSITLNGPYSINCAVKGDGGDTSVLGCHFWVRSEARSIQILSPRTSRSASADPVTMPGRYDVRIQNDGAEYPRDTVLEYNPKVDGTITPGSGKPYVTETDNAADTCPVLNVGINTLIRYGNTKWAFEKAITGASDLAFDFSRYDIFKDPASDPMTGNRTYTITNPVKDKVICIVLPPVGTAVITWPSSVNFLQGILQDNAYNVVYIHCLDDETPYYVATISQIEIPS